MVLEEATIPIEDTSFTRDEIPSSDFDTYSSNSPARSLLSVDVSALPHAFPILGPLLGYTEKNLKKTVISACALATHTMKRPLRKEEMDSLLYNFAKIDRTTSYGAVLGIAAGLSRSWSTADKFKLPFVKADMETFNASVFLSNKGPAARAAIHAARGLSYAGLGWVFGAMFAKTYAATVLSVAIASDPRLKDFNKALKEASAKRSGRPMPAPNQSQLPPHAADSLPRGFDGDDMSPQSSYDANSGMLSDAEMRSQEVGQISDEQTFAAETQRPSYTATRPPRYSNPDVDDISPTTQSPSVSSARESAWDRVRRQSGQQQSQTPRNSMPRHEPGGAPDGTSGRENSPLGDSFTFSAADEERQLAKSEAQQEFDARVDRERQGRDFEGGSRGGKQW